MTWTPTTILIKDASGNNQPVIAYTDGTNFAFAHPLLDNTGAIIAPATAGNQSTMITALSLLSTSALQTTGNTLLAEIQSAVAAPIPAGTNSIGAVTANAGTNLNTSALALDTSVNGLLVAQGATTSGQKGPLVQGAVSTSAPTLTTGQTSPLSIDTSGNLRVVVSGGSSGGGTSSNFASTFPTAGTAIGAKNGANMVNVTADASGNLNVNLETSLPAGTNLVGSFAPPGSVHLTAAPTVTAGTYTNGMVVGGLVSLSGAARTTAGSGMVQSALVTVQTALTAPFDVLFFDTNPTHSTFTDNAALSLNTADLPFLCGVAHCTDLVSLGTPQALQATNLAIPFRLAAGTTLYAVIVIRGGETFASTSAIGLSAVIVQD